MAPASTGLGPFTKETMDSIRIDTGIKRIQINDGPDYIEFNPTDVLFAERFYAAYQEFNVKQSEFQQRSEELDAHKDELDENGLPVNVSQGLAFLHETCEFMRSKIDYLFGAGTSQKVFGDALNLDVIGQFLDAMTPYIQVARSEKVAKYTPPPKTRGRAVMK